MTEIQELRLKYRPTSFDEFLGNEVMVKSLKSVIHRKEGRPHTLLFQGPSGCGKTTLARILATELGCGSHDFYEYNISDMTGVDTARSIISKVAFSPLSGKCKVYVLNECFSKGTKIRIVDGEKNIEEIKVGDVIFNLEGKTIVKSVFNNRILINKVVKLKLSNNKEIICSDNHLFFTRQGWIKAKDLKKDIDLFDFGFYNKESIRSQLKSNKEIGHGVQRDSFKKESLSTLWERFFIQSLESKILWFLSKNSLFSKNKKMSYLWKEFFKSRESKSLRQMFNFKRKAMQVLWKNVFTEKQICRILWTKLCWQMEKFTTWILRKDYYSSKEFKSSDGDEGFLQEWIYEKQRSENELFRKNEEKQSVIRFKKFREGKKYKENKWNSSYLEWKERWKWYLDRASNTFSYCFRLADGDFCCVGSQNNTSWGKKKVFEETKFVNQVSHRYWESKIKNSDRSGWSWTQVEEQYLKRQKERKNFKRVGVESVEIYKRGSNDEFFRSVIGDKERNQGYVEFYDLEIQGHPSYFANDILVHNCHMASKQFQNAMLDVLEDPPSHVYFILCTTEPEKLLPTIRGQRASIFEVKSLNRNEIIKLVKDVCEKEGVELSSKFYTEIASCSEGSPRAALNILDKIIDIEDDEQAFNAINSASVEETEIKELLQLLVDGKSKPSHKQIATLIKGINVNDIEKTRLTIKKYMGSVFLNSGNDRHYQIMRLFLENFYYSGREGLIDALTIARKI